MQVLYVFHDAGVPGAAKIGLNRDGKTPWPYRFMQARSHSPRPIHVAAAWDLGSRKKLEWTERDAKDQKLKPWRRDCSGTEWFDLPADEIVERLTRLYALPAAFLRNEDPSVPVYDDWRETKEVYKDQVWRSFLWIHGEEGPERRLKVIHSTLYDIAYRYAFTYNPYHVRLVAAYEHPDPADGPSETLRPGNRAVQKVWRDMVADRRFAESPDAPQVGWLRPGVALADADAWIHASGLVRFDLRRPKPMCAMPRNSQGGDPIPNGSMPPLRRVADWF